MTEFLLKKKCDVIVIACNTATTSCMNTLREKYKDVIFVGTVPAIKVAYDNNYKNTIILSTPYTTKSKRVDELITNYHNSDQVITTISGGKLANLIELDRKEEIDKLLNNLLLSYRNKADSLVLGCTHYSLIKDAINKVLPNTVLLDGTVGVAKEVKHQLELNNLINNKTDSGKIIIKNNKDDELIERSYDILYS